MWLLISDKIFAKASLSIATCLILNNKSSELVLLINLVRYEHIISGLATISINPVEIALLGIPSNFALDKSCTIARPPFSLIALCIGHVLILYLFKGI